MKLLIALLCAFVFACSPPRQVAVAPATSAPATAVFTYFQTYNDTDHLLVPDDEANVCWDFPNADKPIPPGARSLVNPLQYNVANCPNNPFIPFALPWMNGPDVACEMIVHYLPTADGGYGYEAVPRDSNCVHSTYETDGGIQVNLITVTQ